MYKDLTTLSATFDGCNEFIHHKLGEIFKEMKDKYPDFPENAFYYCVVNQSVKKLYEISKEPEEEKELLEQLNQRIWRKYDRK